VGHLIRVNQLEFIGIQETKKKKIFILAF
jgi:hypothetical protein